jgi:hypothetical protein
MMADQVFSDVDSFAKLLHELRAKRRGRVIRTRRAALRRADRGEVLGKTGGRCHICGGIVEPNDWQADHVLAQAAGGKHSVDNYLPAHTLCNNYRWNYDAEEFQWILKLGVWLRTQIETKKPIGLRAGQTFCDYDRKRAGRKKPTVEPRLPLAEGGKEPA